MTPPRLLRPVLVGVLALAGAGGAEGEVGRAATPDRYESDDHDRGDSSQAALPTASPSAPPLPPEQATAAASRVLLVPEDLPGGVAAPADEQASAELAAAWQTYRSCVGANAERLVDVPSDSLSRTADDQAQLATATTAVLADPGALAENLAAYRGDEAAGCARDLAADAVTSLAGEGAQLAEPEVTDVRPDLPSGAQSFGHRVTTTASADGREVPVSVDVAGVAAGRTEVLVLLLSVGEQVPEPERDALLGRLAERAADGP